MLPFGLFLPQPFASIAAALMIASQLYLVVTGNYSWLNWITIIAIVAGISDSAIDMLLPGLAPTGAAAAATRRRGSSPPACGVRDRRRRAQSYWPVRNLLSRTRP